jgi:hypothetical protein
VPGADAMPKKKKKKDAAGKQVSAKRKTIIIIITEENKSPNDNLEQTKEKKAKGYPMICGHLYQ